MCCLRLWDCDGFIPLERGQKRDNKWKCLMMIFQTNARRDIETGSWPPPVSGETWAKQRDGACYFLFLYCMLCDCVVKREEKSVWPLGCSTEWSEDMKWKSFVLLAESGSSEFDIFNVSYLFYHHILLRFTARKIFYGGEMFVNEHTTLLGLKCFHFNFIKISLKGNQFAVIKCKGNLSLRVFIASAQPSGGNEMCHLDVSRKELRIGELDPINVQCSVLISELVPHPVTALTHNFWITRYYLLSSFILKEIEITFPTVQSSFSDLPRSWPESERRKRNSRDHKK